ncbi:hypothetical protein HMF8227_00494 [Saliniradius amylolyticus]|uniref:Uncharacterized protein n=2 Tax=Saliniradius amylolyticus TaxID=2183582 RepID=A0A2S2E134_9ALTE|nr:hypothetical protein HMF8227_00494 [Saliniradius amylolyticus]
MRFYLMSLALLALVAYLGYEVGHYRQQAQDKTIQGLRNSLTSVTDKNNELVRKLNVLGVELEVERLANQNNQSQLHQAIQGQAALKQELSFYQRVMAPELQEQGVAIDDFTVQPSSIPGHYHFSLVMMQQSQRNEFVRGKASVLIFGSQQGKDKQYDLLELDTSVNGPLSFNFRFFEVLEGNFTLPEGFIPERVEVHFSASKPERQSLHRAFVWPLGEQTPLADNN